MLLFKFVDLILECLTGDDRPHPTPYEKPFKFVRRFRAWERKKYYQTLRQMKKQGLIKVYKKAGKKFIQCTEKGQLAILLSKACIRVSEKWDGFWRLIVFDIPESSNEKRRLFRHLLRENSFAMLQASVYISPYRLNRSAISYLKQSGLFNYIRILKVTEIDDDSALKKKFGLK